MNARELLINGYNRLANDYARAYCDELDRKPFDRELLEQFVRRIPAGKPVCDLGCGSGHVANHLKSLGADVLGVDLSPGMVAVARQRFPSIEYRVGDMLDLHMPCGLLGGIVCFYSIIHLERDELGPVAAEMFRLLAEGGRALISFHRGQGTLHDDTSLGKPVPFDCTLFEPEEATTAMKQAGFSIERVTVREPYPFEYPTTRVYVEGVRRQEVKRHSSPSQELCPRSPRRQE